MSVVGTAKELIDSPEADVNQDGREYVRRFLVQTSTVLDGPLVASSAPGLPLMFTAFTHGGDFDLLSRLRGFRASRVPDAPLYWHVDAVYRTLSHPNERPDEGLFEPTEIEVDTVTVRSVVAGILDQNHEVGGEGQLFTTRFFDGPFVTAANEPFDPPFEDDQPLPAVNITRTEGLGDFTLRKKIQFENSINSDPFMGAEPRQARIIRIGARKAHKIVDDKFESYWRVRYQIVFKREGWEAQLLNQGTFYYDGGFKNWTTGALLGGVKTPFLDDQGHPHVGLLDNDGDKLADDAFPTFGHFRYLKENAFAALNLPQDLNEELV